jgi:hypothetical protein
MSTKLAVAIALVVLVAAGAILLLGITKPHEVKFAESVTFERLETYVMWDGSASCRYLMWQPPSYISSFNKLSVQRMGEDVLESIYEEEMKRYYAMMGFEIDNFSCEISGTGENDNFTLLLTWSIPRFARWDGDRWEIQLDWVNRNMGAEDAVSESDSNWIVARSIAKASGFDFGIHTSYSVDSTFLPEGAADVRLDSEAHWFLDYGGGSYSETSIRLQQVEGRHVVVENGVFVTSAENEMSITVDQLLENYAPVLISYSGPGPDNWSLAGSFEWARLDMKYGRDLRENYPVRIENSWHYLTPAQMFYCSAMELLAVSRGEELNAISPPQIPWPEQEEGDWNVCWSELSMGECLSLADQVSKLGSIPEWFETSAGRIRPSDLFYTFLRVLSVYEKSGSLPDRILVAPVPKGRLTWGSTIMGADNAYYLLSDLYVVVGGERSLEVLENIRDELDNRKLVEEICNWTGSNITYGLSFRPPTSEETLVSRRGQCRDYTNVYLAIARGAGIPARRISGWIVSRWQPPAGWEFVVTTTPDGKTVGGHAWVEAFVPGEGWIPLEPQSSRPSLLVGNLPYDVYKQTRQTWIGALAGYEAARGNL